MTVGIWQKGLAWDAGPHETLKLAQIAGFLLLALGAVLYGGGYASGDTGTGIRVALAGLLVWAIARTVEWYRKP